MLGLHSLGREDLYLPPSLPQRQTLTLHSCSTSLTTVRVVREGGVMEACSPGQTHSDGGTERQSSSQVRQRPTAMGYLTEFGDILPPLIPNLLSAVIHQTVPAFLAEGADERLHLKEREDEVRM